MGDDPRCRLVREPGDSGWLLSHCFKVIMMQAGFAVVESSFVRHKNSVSLGLFSTFSSLPWKVGHVVRTFSLLPRK
jgi:ammonia channel protein AmtB